MSKIYEQVSANLPGKPFRPSGFYRHAGDMVNKKFIKATRPSPLRTYAQLKAQEASTPSPGATRWYCPMCLTLLPVEQNADGTYKPCTKCNYAEWTPPQHVPADDKYTMTYAAPDTLARVVERQRAIREGLPLPAPQPMQMIRLGPPPRPYVATPMGSTLDRVLSLQEQRGLRPADPYKPLRTMDTTTPCTRCRKSPAMCACVPLPPDTLAECAKRAAIRTQQEQDAAMIAYPQLRKV